MILGLNYSSYHDSAIALINSTNTVSFAASEERYSRVKKDGRFPIHSLAQIDLGNVDFISVPYLEHPPTNNCSKDPLFEDFFYQSENIISAFPNSWHHDILALGKQVFYFDHHDSHAAVGIFFSGFQSCNIITSDFGADNTSTSTGIYKYSSDRGLIKTHSADIQFYEPLCSIYTFTTTLLGFRPNHHEGKITGLAATAPTDKSTQTALELIFKEYLSLRGSSSRELFQWAGRWRSDVSPDLIIDSHLVNYFRQKLSKFSDASLARAAQDIIEHRMLGLLNRINLNLNDPLVLSGGLFSNVKLNLAIKRLGFKNIFICPPMGDEGLAIGSAVLLNQHNYSTPIHISQLSTSTPPSVFLGSTTRNDGLNHLADIVTSSAPTNLPKHIAEILSNNFSVAIVRGEMEFGPRSLGHRSILHSASKSSINDSLNKKLNRTEFMPFAPIMRIESAKFYLDSLDLDGAYQTSKFMTICIAATPKFKSLCPAVVHVDGTCRPQLVDRNSDPFIYDVLSIYEDLTGLPALINTSFNMHEEPIVCSFTDALKSFIFSDLDFLVYNEFLISKSDVSTLKKILTSFNKSFALEKNNFKELELEFWKSKFLKIDELLNTHKKHISNLEDVIKHLKS
jgi:carbamoyltransferase